MAIVYAWLWSYWGALVFGVGMGFIAALFGIDFDTKEGRDNGLLFLGSVYVIGTVIYGILWAIFGPFSIYWIIVPATVLGALIWVAGASSHERELVWTGVLLVITAGGIYTAAFNGTVHAALLPRPVPTPEGGARFTKAADGWWYIAKADSGINNPGGALPRVLVRDFWPAHVITSAQGLLTTTGGTPVRVLASGYLTPLFDSAKAEFPGGVVGVMQPFRAYYALRRQGPALQVGESPNAAQPAVFWVRLGDCYVWSTGQAAEVTTGVPVYASDEQASTASQPLVPPEKYTDITRLVNSVATGPPPLTRLPVLLRSGDVAALLCPAYGGQLCWVNTASAGAGVVVRENQ